MAASSLSRPPSCFSNMLRCLTMRSSSRRSASYFRARATSTSSRKRRRSPGPSLITVRSSGENTVTRMTPSRSRDRPSFCRLTSTRLRPFRVSSNSTEHLAPVVVHHRGAHDRRIGADTDQRVERGAAEAVERGQVGHGFGQVGLALAVEPDDRSGTRVEVERRRRVVAEVDELEPRNDHGRGAEPAIIGTRTGITARGRASTGTGSRRHRRRARLPASTSRASTA